MFCQAADLTGMWSGTMETIDRPEGKLTDQHYFSVKQSGDSISGTIGPKRDGPWSVQGIKLAGGKLAFDVATSSAPNALVLSYNLQVNGDQMSGTVEAKKPGLKWKIMLNKEK